MEQATKRRRNRAVPEESRVRATRACANCRRLKEKCDGNEPCARCQRTGRNCIQLAGVRASAKALDNDAERIRYLEQLLTHFLGPVSLDLPNLRCIVSRIIKRPSNVSGDDSVLTTEAELEDLTLEETDFAVKPISQNTAHYSGELSHWNFSQNVRRRVDEHLHGSYAHHGVASSDENSQILEYWRANQLRSTGSQVVNALDCLPRRRAADAYVQAYFRFAQTNTFSVEPQWLNSKLDILYTESVHLNSADSSWVCTALMVLAIGFQFFHINEESYDEPNPSPQVLQDEEPFQNRDASRPFYRMATMLVPDIITIASMESVQACLVLALYTLPLDAHGLAYTYLGLAMKLAIQNGMHRKYIGNDLDEWTVEMRNRLWWSSYTLERRISILHGRPTFILPSEMDADLPRDIVDLRSADYTFSFQNMITMIHMTKELSDISDLVSQLRRCPKPLQSLYFRNVLERCDKFKRWWRTIMDSTTEPTPTTDSARAHVHLKLWFHVCEIFVGRPFMFTSKDQTQSSPKQGPSSVRASRRATLVGSAVEAAYEIIHLLRNLDETTGLARASYVEFSAGRASLLLLLAQSLNERSSKLFQVISLGMRLIRSMATGNIMSVKSETSVIETLFRKIQQLHVRDSPPNLKERDVNQTTNDSGQRSYVNFNEWDSIWADLDTSYQFPGLDIPISPQGSILPDSVAWDQPEMVDWFAERCDFTLGSIDFSFQEKDTN